MVLHSLPVAPFTHAFPRSLSCGIETQDACFRIDSLRRCRCCCLAIPRTLSISFCSQDRCYAARLAVVFHIFFQLALFNSTFRSLARSIQGCFFCTFISLGPFVSSAVLFLDLSFLFFYPLSIPYVFFPRPIRLSIFSFYFIQRSEADGVRELLYRLVRILQGTSCSALERRKSVKSWWSGSMLFQ